VYCAAEEFGPAWLACVSAELTGVNQPGVGPLPTPPPLRAPRLVGIGTASLGPVHQTQVDDPDNFFINDYLTIDQVSMSGALLFGTKSFAGQLHLGRMTGYTTTCISTPGDSEDLGGIIDGCGGVTDTLSPNPYQLSPNPVALSGQNGKGQTVSGSCSGGTYEPLSTTCTATLTGGPTATFNLTVLTEGQSETAIGHGVFIALGT
jgi:hypothetical protein